MIAGNMLVPGQGVTDKDRVRRFCIERAVSFIGNLDGRKCGPAVELQGPGQDNVTVEAKRIRHAGGAKARDPALSMKPTTPRAARIMTGPSPKDWVKAIHPYVPVIRAAAIAAANRGWECYGIRDGFNGILFPERYPDGGATALRESIAQRHGLDPDRIICGTGSDEVLHQAAGAFAGPGDEVIYVRYGFAVYEIAIRRVGATPVIAPDRDYATDVDAILAAVTERTRVVFVANPNNPTSTYTPREEIARLHAGLPDHVLLVLDQAYAEYLEDDEDDGGLALAMSASNVLVTRTFSKIFGLAAERIGWGYAADKLGNAGLRTLESKANFLLVLFNGAVTAESAYHSLMERGYIVRWLPGQGLGHGLRVSIGSEEETRGFAAALREIVGEAA